MSVMLTNNAKSRLASSIGISDTTIAITSGEGVAFPSPGPEDWFPLTLVKDTGAREIVRCTARVGDVFTVERAQEGTEALSFSVGDRVELRLTAEVINELAALVGNMQPGDPRLDMLTELELAANNLLYATGENSLALSPLTAFARSLLDDADADAVLETLGLDQTGVFKTGPTGAARIPVGTTAQRPTSPGDGLFRLNSTLDKLEFYRDGDWSAIAEQVAVDLLVAAYEAVNQRVDGAVMGSQFTGSNRSFAANGFQKFPGGAGSAVGLIVQWGTTSGSSPSGTQVTFPIAFPNACGPVLVNSMDRQDYQSNVSARTKTGFTVHNYLQSRQLLYFAIGY